MRSVQAVLGGVCVCVLYVCVRACVHACAVVYKRGSVESCERTAGRTSCVGTRGAVDCFHACDAMRIKGEVDCCTRILYTAKTIKSRQNK